MTAPKPMREASTIASTGEIVVACTGCKVLTASVARNVCQTGWEPVEGETDQAISRLKWKPADHHLRR